MKAYRISTSQIIPPFNDPVREVRILDVPLFQLQERLLAEAGYTLVEEVPQDEPYLLISDRVWCTLAILKELKKYIGRVRIADPRWIESTHPLQQLTDGAYDLAVMPKGSTPVLSDAPILDWDAQIKEGEPLDLHPAIAHAAKPICQTPFMVHHIDHWSHIPRVNMLAILAQAEQAKYRWKNAGTVEKLFMILGFFWKIRSFSKRTMLARIGKQGKKCRIHPTAVIEACQIGDNVEIGPHAVVRASVIGDNAKIDEHCVVNLSVVGQGARVGRTAILNLSILYPKAMYSHGLGLQGSVFGQESFLAIGVTGLDISFGKTIQVLKEGEWVDSGMHFLGVAVGHKAIIGNAVRLNYGVSVPNEAIIIGPKDDLFLDASQAPAGVPCIWKDGVAAPIKKVQPSRPDPE